jgi:hypothetical protein
LDLLVWVPKPGVGDGLQSQKVGFGRIFCFPCEAFVAPWAAPSAPKSPSGNENPSKTHYFLDTKLLYCICSLGRDRVFLFSRPFVGRGGRVFCKTRVGKFFQSGVYMKLAGLFKQGM